MPTIDSARVLTNIVLCDGGWRRSCCRMSFSVSASAAAPAGNAADMPTSIAFRTGDRRRQCWQSSCFPLATAAAHAGSHRAFPWRPPPPMLAVLAFSLGDRRRRCWQSSRFPLATPPPRAGARSGESGAAETPHPPVVSLASCAYSAASLRQGWRRGAGADSLSRGITRARHAARGECAGGLAAAGPVGGAVHEVIAPDRNGASFSGRRRRASPERRSVSRS